MSQQSTRRALVVRGGWEGHSPVEATERFIPFLEDNGFVVDVKEDLDIYLDAERLADTDLVLQCWTMGEITDEQLAGLTKAVEAGTGLAGWHGGICDSFRANADYLHLVGGQFACHPGAVKQHEIRIAPERADHPIVAGIEPSWTQETEQYWVLADGLNDVLAISRHSAGDDTPWHRDYVSPAVWTRQWGQGRIFVSTIGHFPRDLDVPPVRTLTERGLLWASR
jgi:uncharacterized protein